MTITAWPYIEVDSTGRPFVEGTPLKVLPLVDHHLAFGHDAVELARQFPPLTLAQSHAALGYYYAHQDECDRLREADRLDTERLLSQLVDPDLQARLAALKSSS
jgi:uncharacterized protein (DUF433 family)